MYPTDYFNITDKPLSDTHTSSIMYSRLLLVVAISSTVILASPVPAAQFEGSTSYDSSFDSAGGSATIAAPNDNIPLPNNLYSPQPKNLLVAAADFATPQPDNLLLTDYTTPQPDNLLADDPRATELCRSQGNCGLLGNPIPTPPDQPKPLTPDLQWLNDKTSQPMTTKFVNFQCGGTESVCCENWHQIPTGQSGSQTTSSNMWLSCSNSISPTYPP